MAERRLALVVVLLVALAVARGVAWHLATAPSAGCPGGEG